VSLSGFLSDRINALRSGDPGKLSVLMATAFIDMVGALMILPLLPFYAVKFGASDFMVMVLVSAFSAMQLVSAPLWGRVSDRYGRKPTLLIGLAGSAVAYVIFAYANTYWLLLVSRLVQGAGGGTTGVIQAYVADSVEPKNRAKGLGWLSAATNLGVVLGPLFGSETTRWGSHAPGLLAAVLCVLNIAFAWRYLTESHDVRKVPGAKPPRRMWDAVAGVAWHRIREPSSRLIWMYSVGIGAFYGVNALIILYLARHFNVTAEKIGPFYAYMGGLSIVFRLFVLGRTVDRFGEARTTRLGATFLALKTEGPVRERSRSVGVRIWVATLVASIVFAAWKPSALSILAAVAVLAAGALLRAGREGWAFTATAAAMAATLSSLFVDLFPNVLISSTDAAYNLTVSGAASGSYALKVMTVAAAIFLPLVLLYQGWTYRVFRARVHDSA